jgi:hypothetical protein
MTKIPVELDEKQKEWIRKNGESYNWAINEITKAVFADNSKDGRSFEGKAVKAFILEEVGVKPKTRTINSKEYKAFELEQHHIDFVLSNAKDITTYEMACILFPELKSKDPKEVLFSKEVKAIQRYIEKNLGDDFFANAREASHRINNYKPPKDAAACVPLVAKYTGQDVQWSKLKDFQKQALEKLKKNLRRASFQTAMEQLRNSKERELLLESFVADTWDKNNLTPGEVSSYMDLAGERVNLYQIKEHEQELKDQFDNDIHGEDGKLRYTLIEAIDKQIQNRDRCMNRIQKLQNDLEGSRTRRLEKEGGDQITVLTLCEELANEKKRKRLLKMIKRERNKVAKSIDEIEEMSDYTARLFGASKDELLN